MLPTGPANAFGGEWLGCRISPPATSTTPYDNGFCETSQAAGSWAVSFAVQNGSGTYTYAWTLHGQYQSPVGCTSTSYFCNVTVTANQANKVVDATVTITQNGQSLTLSAEAYFDAVCPIGGRFEFC
jgi:hypothetical protein